MKKLISFLLISTIVFASTKDEDLQVIIEKNELHNPNILEMLALDEIIDSGKNIDAQEIVQQMQEKFTEKEFVNKFAEPFCAVFSEEEMKEIRQLYETKLWEKYSKEAGKVFQAQVEIVLDQMKLLVEKHPAEKNVASLQANILQITQENQSAMYESKLPMIIDIKANWCGPCKKMKPIIDDLSVKYDGVIQFATIDSDTQAALTKQFNIKGLPTLLFMKPGTKEPVMKTLGFINKKDLEEKIAEFLKD